MVTVYSASEIVLIAACLQIHKSIITVSVTRMFPSRLELMVKLRTLLTVFTFILKAEVWDYGKGRYISDTACGVRPITMHWASWPIRADCACRKEGLCRIDFYFSFYLWKQLLLLVMKIIGIVESVLLFVYIHNKNKSLHFCKITLKIGCLMPSGFLLRSTKIKTETLLRLLVAQFFFCFLKLLFKWKYNPQIGLFIHYNKYIYISKGKLEKEGKLKITKNKLLDRIAADMKVKVKRAWHLQCI